MPSQKGIDNAKSRDARKIQCICENCGAHYEITYGRYRRIKNDPNYKYRCSDCFHKLWYSELPLEKKAKFDQAHVDRWQNMSEEDKAHYSELSRLNWENKSDEEKLAHAETSSKNLKKFWDSASDEYRIAAKQRLKSIRDEYFETRSDEEKERVSKILSEHMIEYWAKMSDDERNKRRQRMSVISKQRFAAMTADEKRRMIDHLSRVATANWQTMTDENRRTWDANRIAGIQKRYEQLSPNSYMNRTEQLVAGMLTLNCISYTPYVFNKNELSEESLVKADYVNPVTGSTFISHHKQWDFRIHTKTADIYLDVDGGIHDPNRMNGLTMKSSSKEYPVAELISYYDSIRKYYHDDIDAYAVKCYDGMIYQESEVENLLTGESMRFDQFIEYIKSIDV